MAKTRKEIKEENEYYAALEKEEYSNQYNGSFEASRGDYEGACLARAEFEAGYIS